MNRWIGAQRIGIAAFCLRQAGSNTAIRDAFERALSSSIRAYFVQIDSAIDDEDEPLLQAVQTLPVSVLYLLNQVHTEIDDAFDDVCEVYGLATALKESIRLLTQEHDPLAPKCSIIAHHILHGSADAKEIASLAEQLFAIRRADRILVGSTSLDRLGELLSDVRSNDLSTPDRLICISEMVGFLTSEMVQRNQLENWLFHHIFSWPLLVSPRPGCRAEISVPVAVDVVFDTKNRGLLRRAQSIGENAYVLGATRIDLETPDADRRTFASYLAQAVRCGRELWRKTHGHAGRWRETIKEVPVVFDFSYVSSAVEGVLGDKLGLDDGSAGAYFSQVVLARLLGRDAYLSSAITGVIGPRLPYPDGTQDRDYEFSMPHQGSLPQKLEYAFGSRMFERIVIPKNEEVAGTIAVVHQTAETLQAAKLSTVADIVQVLGWRRTHYVRCPELAWAIHGPKLPDKVTPKGSVSKDHSTFLSVRAGLAENEQTIARLSGVSPIAVASYLWYFDQVVRQRQNHISPALSWAFIRAAADYEQDASFWHVLWRITGAPLDGFEAFQCSPTSDAAVSELRKVLNSFEPSKEAKSHRAPDVIVLIGANQLEDDFSRLHNQAQRPLAVPKVLAELEQRGQLIPSPRQNDSPHFREWFGNTRLILIDEEPFVRGRARVSLDATPEELQVLHYLSTFKWSFKQSAAALVLRELQMDGVPIKGHKLHEVLTAFAEPKRDLLRCIFGEYYLPNDVRRAVEEATKGERYLDQARRHFAVGLALAPYGSVTEVPGLAYDTAFLPERVHEAQSHLSQAGKLFEFDGDDVRKKMSRDAQTQVMRFARVIGWGTVFGSIKSKDRPTCKQAYLFAEDFMERWRNHPHCKSAVNHPVHLVNAARALHHTDFRSGEIDVISKRYWNGTSDQVAAIVNLFGRAREACHAFPGEEIYNRLMVLSEFSDFLNSSQGKRFQDMLQEVDDEIRQLQPNWHQCPGAIRGSWFEAQGDSCREHKSAAYLYADGAQSAREWHQLKVKGAGALCLANLHHQLLNSLRDLPSREGQQAAMKALVGAKKAIERDYRKPKGNDQKSTRSHNEHLFERWEMGFRFLRDAWKQFPDCIRMIDDIMGW